LVNISYIKLSGGWFFFFFFLNQWGNYSVSRNRRIKYPAEIP